MKFRGQVAGIRWQEFPRFAGRVPLTRPSDDLSHKGRGVLTHDQPLALITSVSDCTSMDTSPLVGEVVRRTGEGYPRPVGASFPSTTNSRESANVS